MPNLSLTVNGVPCDPNFCQVDADGYSFNANAILDVSRNFIDLRYSMQSVVPVKPGGSLTVVASADAPAISISGEGPPLGTGSAVPTLSASHSGVSISMELSVGPNQIVGGDLLATWVSYVAPPEPPTPPTPPEPPQPPAPPTPPQPPTCTTCQPSSPQVPALVPTLDAFCVVLLILAVAVLGLLKVRR